jgi:glycosyltransferase involved in cell wall biosynthesis
MFTKVLMVTFEFGEAVAGGIGTCLNGLYPELGKLIELHVCRLWWNASRECFSAEFFSGDLNANRSESHFLESIPNYVTQKKIHNLHVHHGSPQIVEVIESLFATAPNINLVYTCHSIFKHEQRIRDIPSEWLQAEDYILKNAQVIHLLNARSVNWLHEHHPELMGKKREVIIPNGYDTALLDYHWLKPSSPTITCLSRWAPGKGIEHLLQARSMVLKLNPNVIFQVGGRDSGAWGDHVQRYMAKLDELLLEDGVATCVHPWMTVHESRALLARSSVVVVPSELEYCPYSFIEPAVIGVPIIASDLPVISDFVAQLNSIKVFPVGSSRRLAETIVEILENPLADKQAANLQHHMLSNYAWSELAPKYLELYQ